MRIRALPLALALLLGSASALALPANQETEHVVKSGETLNGIANRAEVARDTIIAANNLEPPYLVRIGQTLVIPRAAQHANQNPSERPARPSLSKAPSHVVESGETMGGIAQRAEIPRVLIAEANGLTTPYTIRIGQKLILPRTGHHTVQPPRGID